MDLIHELARLSTEFESAGIEYALCGGLAMAVHAFPRATLDIDLLIPPEMLERAKAAASQLGFTVDEGLLKLRAGTIQIYRMGRVFAESQELLVLDLLLVTPDTHPAWETRQQVTWEHGELSVVSPEGLIALKSLRQSGQDQDDIKHLRGLADEA